MTWGARPNNKNTQLQIDTSLFHEPAFTHTHSHTNTRTQIHTHTHILKKQNKIKQKRERREHAPLTKACINIVFSKRNLIYWGHSAKFPTLHLFYIWALDPFETGCAELSRWRWARSAGTHPCCCPHHQPELELWWSSPRQCGWPMWYTSGINAFRSRRLRFL